MFRVIDPETGRYPDLEEVARDEGWATGLVYCDMNQFYIGEDGSLVLADDCGNIAEVPEGRFWIIEER